MAGTDFERRTILARDPSTATRPAAVYAGRTRPAPGAPLSVAA